MNEGDRASDRGPSVTMTLNRTTSLSEIIIGSSATWYVENSAFQSSILSVCMKGNVRELRHPYLATSKWHRDGQWADCQANDVRRALLSYLNLIRRAAVDSEAFDQQFLCRSSPLGELYWRFMEQPILAKELQDGLKSGSRETSAESFASCRYSQESPFWTVSKPWVSKRVNLELRWSTAPDKFTFWTH